MLRPMRFESRNEPESPTAFLMSKDFELLKTDRKTHFLEEISISALDWILGT